MHVRLSKALLVLSVALFASLVAVNNLTDYDSNFQYVRHVLSMDTTFPDNEGMWRRIESAPLHHLAYALIIAVEIAIAVLCWLGGVQMWRARRAPAAAFEAAKRLAIWGLTAGILLWFTGFIAIGGEWFLMWQSEVWNGQPESAMFATIVGLILLYVVQPDAG